MPLSLNISEVFEAKPYTGNRTAHIRRIEGVSKVRYLALGRC